jgi:hypothetical protein
VPDQRSQHGPVGPVQPGPGIGAAQHGDLVPQHQQLNVFESPRAAEQDKPAAEPNEDEIQQAKEHGRSSWSTADTGVSPQLRGYADYWHPAGSGRAGEQAEFGLPPAPCVNGARKKFAAADKAGCGNN